MKKNSVKYFGIASVLLASCIFVVPLNAQGPRGGGHSGGFSAGGAHGGGVSGGGMHVENRGFSGSRAPERRSDFTAPQRNFDGRDAGRGVPRDVGRDEGRNWRRSPGDAGNIGSGAARIDGNPGYRNIYGERGYYGNPGNHDVYGRPGRPMEPPYPMGPPHPMGPSHPIAAPMYHPYHEPYMPYYYDPVRFRYGWQPDYRPVYPWWIGATEYGAGYAMGYYVSGGTPVYYYYPAETAPSGGSVAVYIDENAGTVQEPASIDASLLEETDPITEAEITQESQSAQIPHSTQASQDVQAFQNAQTSVLVDDSQTAQAEQAAQLPQITKAEVDGAWKNIQEADGLFADGDIASAYAKYSQVTTDLEFMPDAWFRLSYTEVARGNYEAAADFCKKGLNASRLWPASPFSMDYMYQSASDRKEKAFAALETAAVNAPGNSDLNLVAGFTFYSDGQNDKAAKFLKIAEKLSPDLEEFIEPVLKAIP